MNLLDPPTYSIYWDLPVLIVVVSLVYSATRYDDCRAILLEAVRWGRRMLLFLGSIALVLYFLGWWVNAGSPLWALILAVGAGVIVVLAWLFVASKS